MRVVSAAILSLATAVTAPGVVLSTSLSIDARTNIFAAAGNGNTDPQSLTPTGTPLPPGSPRVMTIQSVTGTVSPLDTAFAFGADGGDFWGLPYFVWASNGIAGIRDAAPGAVLPLVAIFTAGTPDPASRPPDRDVTFEKANFVTFPLLNQPFFVGDGRTPGGAVQSFMVPSGATHVWFGFADAVATAAVFDGPPGAYFDNTGALNVSFTVTPEPLAGGYLALGLIALLRRRGR